MPSELETKDKGDKGSLVTRARPFLRFWQRDETQTRLCISCQLIGPSATSASFFISSALRSLYFGQGQEEQTSESAELSLLTVYIALLADATLY